MKGSSTQVGSWHTQRIRYYPTMQYLNKVIREKIAVTSYVMGPYFRPGGSRQALITD